MLTFPQYSDDIRGCLSGKPLVYGQRIIEHKWKPPSVTTCLLPKLDLR
jgi:hypothetical protein